ncbi:MAG: cytochrome C [Desulfuromonas sp.]|nr:cytochrome C [Desulfuromonas sp.]
MKISKRDLIFISVILSVLAFLLTGTLKKLGKDVPETEEHLVFYQQLDEGGSRIGIEKGCTACHEIQSLPESHPEKEECMVCHLRK